MKFVSEVAICWEFIIAGDPRISNMLCHSPSCKLKRDSSSTKLRVAFDASAKMSTGISLNDVTSMDQVYCSPFLFAFDY